MAITLPYLATPGNIPKVFEKIKSVPTPSRVTQDFVKVKLQIPGGSGDSMTAFLRKIGFVKPDGSPSDLYIKARNPQTVGTAIAAAFKQAYAPLYEHNEYLHALPEEKLKGLIIQVTGCGVEDRTVYFTLKSMEQLRRLANFNEETKEEPEAEPQKPSQLPATLNVSSQEHMPRRNRLGMNLSYTINLNLPPSTDIAVFNAIFKSLKENLLKDADEHSS